MDTAGGTDDDLGAVLERLHVITDRGAANAGVALNVHEVTDGDNDLLDLLGQLTGGGEDEGLALLDSRVDLLEGGDGESGRLASTRLGLGNDIVTLDDGHDGAHLDSRGTLKTVGVNCGRGELVRTLIATRGIGIVPSMWARPRCAAL